MNEYLVPVTSACTLISLNYIAIKIRGKMLIDAYEQWLAPLFTGLACVIMMLEPLPEPLGLVDLRSLPIFMAGLRYGLPIALLSSVLPAGFSYFLHENHFGLNLLLELLAPAFISSYFHNREYRGGFLDIPIRHGLQMCSSMFLLHLVTHSLVVDRLVSWNYTIDQLFMLAIMCATFIVIIAMVNDENSNWRLQRQLELQANQDGLTRLPNLRSFMPITANALRRRRVSIMMIDIDNFKQYNDHFGHQAGDQLLCDISAVLRLHIQEEDYLARYGGEEFILMSTEVDPVRLAVYAGKLLSAVSDAFFDRGQLDYPPVTISIGIACARMPQDELRRVIAEADEALYRSKHAGKNRHSFYLESIASPQQINA